MKVHKLPFIALSIALTASISVSGAEAQKRTAASTDNASVTYAIKEQRRLYNRAKHDAERVERDLAAMVLGRSWNWGLNAKRDLRLLDTLRRDLAAFQDSEFAFEKSLASEESSRFQSKIDSIHHLMRHLQGDAESLDTELRQKLPTRWHVAQDIMDMRKEIRRGKRLQQQIATALAIDH